MKTTPRHSRLLVCLVAWAAVLAGSEARSDSILDVSVYATLAERPMTLSFGADGELFVGSSRTEGADIDASWVYRVAPGGGVASTYGNARLLDPDAVLFDADGRISGVAGSVIVGGVATWNGIQERGRLSAIRPDGTIQSIDSPLFQNPVQMAFDSTGRMLFTNQGDSRGVFAVTPGPAGNQLSQLIGFPDPLQTPRGLAIGPGDLIYTAHVDGVIRVHASDGSLVNDAFATVFDPTGWLPGERSSGLAFANGGLFGTDLYATTGRSGEILRISPSGQTETILSGLGGITGIAFGPDGAMYLSDHQNFRILRVAPSNSPPAVIPEPASLVLFSLGGLAVAGLRFRIWSRNRG
ncbi:PEP-CTERM sorting domain-containing protein [Tautonia sp. JC769]|uniref:PEP-CTERM sorting domain-containing protein n=1 Tax=Tautonia sp. JC769 TaxID=3232135 RepID=UPI003457CEC8